MRRGKARPKVSEKVEAGCWGHHWGREHDDGTLGGTLHTVGSTLFAANKIQV